MASTVKIFNRYCPVCGVHFYVSPKRLIRNKGIIYCSRQCQKDDPKNGLKEANRHCKRCGKPFYAKKADIDRGYGHYCSKQCSSISTVPRGESHFRFRGRVINNGYIYVTAPDGHPKATKNGYIPMHTLVMEEHIGRYLTNEEVVHHINHIRDDNRIENLQLMSKADHYRLHADEHKENKSGSYVQCPICSTPFYKTPNSTKKTCSHNCGQKFRRLG